MWLLQAPVGQVLVWLCLEAFSMLWVARMVCLASTLLKGDFFNSLSVFLKKNTEGFLKGKI